MEYLVISFRSRAHTVRFAEFLRKNGVYCQIINTPKEAGVGCGLSVRVSVKDRSAAQKAARITDYASFAGFFLVKTVGAKRVIKSI
ncbi:MAG: DUF3343 domain-containing protein [Clostridia bacterium]|nr:DUF3343 domain-containing protein [Clostridia bacterium]